MTLQERFSVLVTPVVNDKQKSFALWEDLSGLYTEKHRAYHNLSHLEELFQYYDTYSTDIVNKETLALAIFYHDCIYNPLATTNEEQSAHFFEATFNNFLDNEHLKNTCDLIIDTKTHESKTADGQLLIDFDIAILGQSPETYQTYTKAIRNEYSMVPSLLYKQGRKKVLHHFLDKESIYKTKMFRNLFEQQARENLKNELQELQ